MVEMLPDTKNSDSAEAGVSASISVEDHRQRILASTTPLPAVTVPLLQAVGRTLAVDVVARVDVPGFDNSAMDGYALRRTDVMTASPNAPVSLEVVADLPAGSPENPRLIDGQAVRIMTGAAIPDDADCVVPIEATDQGTTRVLIRQVPVAAAHIRRASTDIRCGETVLKAGVALTSTQLAAAAATGLGELPVHPAPRVGVLSTGSELRAPGEALDRGEIHDSNSFLLAAAVEECGGVPIHIGAVTDDEDALRETLQSRAADVDVFVTSGGVSVGAYDIVKAVLAPLGVWFGPVRMQPGKPQGFGCWLDGTPIFTLPGNPVSVFVSFEAFVRPALLALQGRSEINRPLYQAVVTEGWRCPEGRAQYMPAIVERQPDGTLTVRPASSGGSGSHLVASLARANALAMVPEEATQVEAGATVHVFLVL